MIRGLFLPFLATGSQDSISKMSGGSVGFLLSLVETAYPPVDTEAPGAYHEPERRSKAYFLQPLCHY